MGLLGLEPLCRHPGQGALAPSHIGSTSDESSVMTARTPLVLLDYSPTSSARGGT
jgi:hypothetical protein